MKFDKKRYYELVKKDKLLRSEDQSLMDENAAENLELLDYGIVISDQLYYN
jgi:hypothetical protein